MGTKAPLLGKVFSLRCPKQTHASRARLRLARRRVAVPAKHTHSLGVPAQAVGQDVAEFALVSFSTGNCVAIAP